MKKEPLVKVIAIAGGTASGKTTVAQKIADKLKDYNIMQFKMDSYYKPFDMLPFAERKKINYDHPNSLDIELLIKQLLSLKQGKKVFQPIYNFTTFTREKETIEVFPSDAIILDGILALAIKEVRELADIKVYIKTDDDIRFIRRLTRDLKYRGRTVESVIKQHLTTVKPMHEFFVEPSIQYADIIVPYYEGNEIAIDLLVTKTKSLLQSKGKVL